MCNGFFICIPHIFMNKHRSLCVWMSFRLQSILILFLTTRFYEFTIVQLESNKLTQTFSKVAHLYSIFFIGLTDYHLTQYELLFQWKICGKTQQNVNARGFRSTQQLLWAVHSEYCPRIVIKVLLSIHLGDYLSLHQFVASVKICFLKIIVSFSSTCRN